MKKILLLATVVLFVSCGKNKTFIQRGSDTGSTTSSDSNGSASSSFSITLTAHKDYVPVQYQDGVFRLNESYNVRIPAYITVVQGSAGNKEAEIYFDNLICTYKSGSKMSILIGTNYHTDIALAQKYVFSHCNLHGGSIGDTVPVMDSVKLAVKDGDSHARTEVKVDLFFVK